ncbi:hypothetical protein TNIN_498951 [Trichonephila inaurata madagascariensis]|uniref:Uncharacterized protein n=1 Tax=Trichonephila inaurata madagascariensis TaxID=2747483 RepID=A0A8X7BPQ8_9ARAC|nr:hypothetical protein TNIN_498951 [Trichonephila inaurata madagascariensis]
MRPDQLKQLSEGNHVSMKIRSAIELPEQLKHLSKGNHVSRKIRSTTELSEQPKHLFSMWYVQGQVHHHAGPLHPANAEDSKYLQIYFLGEDEQVQRRLDLLDSPVDKNILKLQRMLRQHNSYARYPTVVHLAVQLEGGQKVYNEPGQPTTHLTDTPSKTALTALFDLCKTDPLAKTLLYSEVPRHFRWDVSQKVWQIRKKVYLFQTSRDM